MKLSYEITCPWCGYACQERRDLPDALVLDLEWFEAQVAPLIGAVKSITVSPERSHQIAAAYKSLLGSASPSLAFLGTTLVVSPLMPDDMFVVVDSRGGVHPCKFGDSHNIGVTA